MYSTDDEYTSIFYLIYLIFNCTGGAEIDSLETERDKRSEERLYLMSMLICKDDLFDTHWLISAM